MPASDHSVLSSYREMLLEHLFAGEIMRHVWLSGVKRMEILKPQVDDGGYDLVLEAGSVVRHVQLKSTFKGSTVRRFNVNTALSRKPSGCVVCVVFDRTSLAMRSFYWFGRSPGRRLPPLDDFPVARHTKGTAKGIKNLRPNIRVVPRSQFKHVPNVSALAIKLFGRAVAHQHVDG